ncbi:MAG: DnaD domain protein [Lachnospiraceae bacterium]|nr:DnaD domain protein [Lachnospiraceae bacterium]
MKKIKLANKKIDVTILPNIFIDKYMKNANGEFIKVYLLLMRYGDENALSIDEMADFLECTEKDVLRAISYWKNLGLIEVSGGSGIDVASNAPEEKKKTEEATVVKEDSYLDINEYKNKKEISQILRIAEAYMGKPLSRKETGEIIYFKENLGMSLDLMDYLLQYCVESNHKNIDYIKKVAENWAKEGISTEAEAKAMSFAYKNKNLAVAKAFGLSVDRLSPAEREQLEKYIMTWEVTYKFNMDIILEAINRTMTQIHTPSFEYTDSILRKWKNAGVKTYSDIENLDTLHSKNTKEQYDKNGNLKIGMGKGTLACNNFKGLNYSDDDLDKKLLDL